MAEHVGELRLRRLRLGELASPEADVARAHLEGCGGCREALRGLEDEERAFFAQVPFERVAAAAGQPRPARRRTVPASFVPWVALAATLVVVLSVAPLLGGRTGTDRLKGGTGVAEVALRVAPPSGGPQRTATPGTIEVLSPGERVRIGYHAGGFGYLASVSVDEQGEVTALYPETGDSLPADGREGLHYLPGSLEFTGRGAERVIVVLSDGPVPVEAVKRAAKVAYDAARGDVARMGELDLDVAAEQFHQTLLKP